MKEHFFLKANQLWYADEIDELIEIVEVKGSEIFVNSGTGPYKIISVIDDKFLLRFSKKFALVGLLEDEVKNTCDFCVNIQ